MFGDFPHGAVGFSAVIDCGISGSYPLTFCLFKSIGRYKRKLTSVECAVLIF